MCTSIYPGFSSNFAFKIGNVFKPGDITAHELALFSESIDLSNRYLRALAEQMSTRVNEAIGNAIIELEGSMGHTEKVMADRLVGEVASSSKKLNARWG